MQSNRLRWWSSCGGAGLLALVCVALAFGLWRGVPDAMAAAYGGGMALAGMLYTRRRQVRVEAMTEIEPGRILLALYGVAFGRMVLMAALFVVAFAGAGLTPVPLLVGFALVQVVSLLRGHRGRKQDSD